MPLSKLLFFNGVTVRFGAVEEVVSRPNGSYLVRFSQRSEAEAALAGARFFESKPVLMDWFEDASTSSGSTDHAVKLEESQVQVQVQGDVADGSGSADAGAGVAQAAAAGDNGELGEGEEGGDGVYEGDAVAAVAEGVGGEEGQAVVAETEDDNLYAGL